MTVKQVIFRCPNADTIESQKKAIGGIAIYDVYDNLQGVICGCCGGIFKPSEMEIVRKLEWVPISQEIIGE